MLSRAVIVIRPTDETVLSIFDKVDNAEATKEFLSTPTLETGR
jgi:hypothetical protein